MKRLFRSRNQKMLGGVCGGLGKYFNTDPLIIRIIFVALSLPGGAPGIIPYLILWVLMPLEPKK